MRFFVFPLLIIVSIFLLSSCTVKKRAYRPGYYVEWNKHLSHVTAAHDKKTKTTEKVSPSEITNEPILSEEEIVSASSEKIITPKTKTNSQKNIFSDDCGDIITMKNGDEVKGKVIEINSTEVKYKRCDNLDGPLITINKSDVFMIKYVNGSKEIFKNESKPTNKNSTPTNLTARTDGQAITGLVFAILSLLILAIMIWLALLVSGSGWGGIVLIYLIVLLGIPYTLFAILGTVLGGGSLLRIKEAPTLHKGKEIAIASLVIGIIELLALVIFVGLVLKL